MGKLTQLSERFFYSENESEELDEDLIASPAYFFIAADIHFGSSFGSWIETGDTLDSGLSRSLSELDK